MMEEVEYWKSVCIALQKELKILEQKQTYKIHVAFNWDQEFTHSSIKFLNENDEIEYSDYRFSSFFKCLCDCLNKIYKNQKPHEKNDSYHCEYCGFNYDKEIGQYSLKLEKDIRGVFDDSLSVKIILNLKTMEKLWSTLQLAFDKFEELEKRHPSYGSEQFDFEFNSN